MNYYIHIARPLGDGNDRALREYWLKIYKNCRISVGLGCLLYLIVSLERVYLESVRDRTEKVRLEVAWQQCVRTMADNNPFQREPSVEDILASIRRILSEDEKVLSAPLGKIAIESKSELEQMSEQKMVFAAGLTSSKKPLLAHNRTETIISDILELTNEMLVDEKKLTQQIVDSSRSSLYLQEKSEEMIGTELQEKAELGVKNRLISPKTTAVSVAALDRLAHSARREQQGDGMLGHDVTLGHGDTTLEALVRDVLQSLLKAWLDEHLSCIIERIVTKEIAHLIHQIK